MLILPKDPKRALYAWDSYIENSYSIKPTGVLNTLKHIIKPDYQRDLSLKTLDDNIASWKQNPFDDVSNWDLILKLRFNRFTLCTAIRVIHDCMVPYTSEKPENINWLHDRTKQFDMYQKLITLGHYKKEMLQTKLDEPNDTLIVLISGAETNDLINIISHIHAQADNHNLKSQTLLKLLLNQLFTLNSIKYDLDKKDPKLFEKFIPYLTDYAESLFTNLDTIFINKNEQLLFYVSSLEILQTMPRSKKIHTLIKQLTDSFINVYPEEYNKYNTLLTLDLLDFKTLYESLIVPTDELTPVDRMELPIF